MPLSVTKHHICYLYYHGKIQYLILCRRKGGNRLVGVGSADSLGMVDNELYKSR